MSLFSRSTCDIRWRSTQMSIGVAALLAVLLALSGCSLPFGDATSARATPTPTAAPTLTRITEFPIATVGAYSIAMAIGGDGNIWFGEYRVGASAGGLPSVSVDRVTPAGEVTTFPVRAQNVAVTSMATGSDGNIWFLETGGPPSASGVLTPYAIGRMK